MMPAPQIPANQDLPQNIECEAALLGALMMDNRLVDQMADRLISAHFFEAVHGRIYEAILREHGLGRRASPITLRPYFEGDEALKQIGGPGYLAQLTGSGAALIGARDFATQIIELARLRALIEIGRNLADAALNSGLAVAAGDEDASFPSLIANLEAAVADVSREVQDGSRELSAAEAADLAIRAGEDSQERGVLSGIESLDGILGPIRRRKMAVVAGRPGMGKSALASSYALGAAERGHGVIFASLEMDAESLAARMLSDLTYDGKGEPVPYGLIESGQLRIHEMRRVVEARDRLAELPLEILDLGQCTTAALNSRIRRWKRRMKAKGQRLELVIVDYLQLLQASRRTRDRIEAVSEVSQDLRRMAKENGVAIMALSQLSRKVEERQDKRPIISDLRESGQIEQDADLILFLFRQQYYLEQSEPREGENGRDTWESAMALCRGSIEFICAKRRQGRTGKAHGRFHGAFGAVRG